MNKETNKKLESMAITTIDPENKYARKQDCYTEVSYFIRNNRISLDSKIVIYSLGNHLGHCILVDNNNNILCDDFSESLGSYNPETRDISYNESLGDGYKFNFEITIKDFRNKFLNDFENIIKRKENEEKNNKKNKSYKETGTREEIPDIEIDYSNTNITIEELTKNQKNKINKKIKNKK